MSNSPSSSGGKGLFQKMKAWSIDLTSPREHRNEPTVLGGLGKAIKDTRDGIMGLLGTTASLPFAGLEMAIAVPNNLLGLTTVAVDRYIVQPIDTVRSKIRELFASPSTFFAGKGGGGGHAH